MYRRKPPKRHRGPKRPGSLRMQLLISVCVGLFLGILVIRVFNTSLRPAVITIASDHLSNQISGEVCEVVNAAMAEENISYDSICTIQWNSEGNISALQSDMAKLSLLQSAITTQVAEAFDDDLIEERVEIPIGNLFPGLSFIGRGPTVSVIVLSVGDISAEFNNEFFADGINQTLHRVVLTVTAELSLLLPGGVYTYTDETKVVLAETVLLGDVPNSYSNFGRISSAEEAYDAYIYYGANED